MAFKLMTWNIERGLHTRRHNLDIARLEAAREVVKKEDPDLFAIVEACYGGPNSFADEINYKEIFGYEKGYWAPYPYFGPGRTDMGGNCLLSKFPFYAQTVELRNKTAIRARIVLEQILTLDIVHPSCGIGDKQKLYALRPLLETIKPPYIITGDFNAVSPEDEYDRKKLIYEYKLFTHNAEYLVDELLKAECVSGILKILYDAFDPWTRESTVPTYRTHGIDLKGVRIDHIFHSIGIRPVETYVLKEEKTEFVSDHYPIVGIFEFI